MAQTIYDILHKEHDEAKKILDRLASSSSSDADMRRDAGSKVAIELISHNEAESQVLYQRLMDFDDMREHVEEHQDEHEEANQELRELLEMDVADSGWLDKLKAIKKAVEQHVADEEGKLFPEAKKHLDNNAAEELGQRFEEEQSRRKKSLKAA